MRLPVSTVRRCTECGAIATEAWWQAPGCAGVARCDEHPPAVRRWDLPSLGVPPVINGPEVFTGNLDTESRRFTGEYAQQATDGTTAARELAEQTRGMIATLAPSGEKAVRMAYGIGEPESDVGAIADDFGLSRSRILQILDKAHRGLRHPSRSWMVGAFVGERCSPPMHKMNLAPQPEPLDIEAIKQRRSDRDEADRSKHVRTRIRDHVEMPSSWSRIYVYDPAGRTRFQIMRSSTSPFGRFVATWTPPVLRNPLHAECATLPTGIAPKPRPRFAFRSPA